MDRFTEMKCVACRRDAPKATEEQIAEYLKQTPEWSVLERDGINRLERVFKFKNFVDAIGFANRVAEAAEAEDHHPAILIEWGSVAVTWWTHKIGGLHQNDFIMAAKTDLLY